METGNEANIPVQENFRSVELDNIIHNRIDCTIFDGVGNLLWL